MKNTCGFCETEFESESYKSFCSNACENKYNDLSDSMVDDEGETLPCACGKK